uniref:Uncharacterized protein n=1 Tax=Plectus sambesii TaxID=2011161 RepID=A0A914XIX3_9BILA
MAVKIDLPEGSVTVVSAYAPPVGCLAEEKEKFSEYFDTFLQNIPDIQNIVTVAFGLAVISTFSQKRDEDLVTFKSAAARTLTDYFLVRCRALREVKNCKVIPGDMSRRRTPQIFGCFIENM